MNLFLHNIGDSEGNVPITRNDALLSDPGERFDYVLTNPPFGKKSSMTFTNAEGEQDREDLVYIRTSPSQISIIYRIPTCLPWRLLTTWKPPLRVSAKSWMN